jgi:hypothetical protein
MTCHCTEPATSEIWHVDNPRVNSTLTETWQLLHKLIDTAQHPWMGRFVRIHAHPCIRAACIGNHRSFAPLLQVRTRLDGKRVLRVLGCVDDVVSVRHEYNRYDL